MLVDIKDENLAMKLIKDGKADIIDVFEVYYRAEVDLRIDLVKENSREEIDENAARKYLLENPPYNDYEYVLDILKDTVSNFTKE